LFKVEIKRISLAEFDIGGVLYHSRYFKLYERARETFLDHLGCSYPSLVAEGCHLAITESQQKFLRPVRYGDSLTLELKAVDLRRASVTFLYEILNQTNKQIVHRASTKHAYVSSKKTGEFRPEPFPSKLYDQLLTFSEKN